ncbi:MAG: hypothetical protein PVS3B2_13650 [Candidatus Dormibacteraceae bacterium]
MEQDAAGRLTARKQRAVALIALALVAIVVTCVVYVVPSLHLDGPAKAKTVAAKRPPSPEPVNNRTTYSFATPSVGWAVIARPIETTVFKTVDRGKHWRVSSRLGGGNYSSAQFVDTTHGFVVSYNPSRLYRTTDGGNRWASLLLPVAQGFGVSFTDAKNGSLLVYPTGPNQRFQMHVTADGGDTWRALPELPQDSFGPAFFRGSEAWLSASGPATRGAHLYTSSDGGLTWSSVEVPRPFQGSAAGAIASAQVTLLPDLGVAVEVTVCTPSQVECNDPAQAEFLTYDRGSTWTPVPPPPADVNYRDVVYQDAVHWWVAGAGTLYRSSDAGQSWKLMVSRGQPTGRVVLHVIDSLHAWMQPIASYGGTLSPGPSFTDDGGLSWTRVPAPTL